ncbi:MAG TPA: VIT1/CCC1 transporter family protein [Actinomycetota bacterium]|nr:VIT1/CCC1 transporter family protein [Actinomycetota bacterium]
MSDKRTERASAETLPHAQDRELPTIPHHGPVTGEQDATHSKSGALRAAIFGLNDGLVSNLSLIFGVAGSGVAGDVVVIAGFAGLLAGAFSMGAGEYVSMKVQREVYEQLIHKEAHELATMPEEELHELIQIYRRKGIDAETAEQISRAVMKDPRIALETHAREELGIDMHEGLGSPWAAAASSFVMFSLGALVPLLPILFLSGEAAVVLSAALSAVTLFTVGGAMTVLTGRGFVFSGLRMLAIGIVAAAITFSVGKLLGVAVS